MIYPDAEVFPDSKTFIPAPKGVIQERTQSAMDEYHQIYRQNNIWKEIMLDEINVTAKYISKTGKLAGEFAWICRLCNNRQDDRSRIQK